MATIYPNPSFNPEDSANELRKAMKGFGTDEDTIIKILCNHSNHQRQTIKESYKNQFGRDLEEDLKSELGGDLETLMVALLDPFPLYLAKELKKAMKGAGTCELTLIEILCPRPNNEVKAICAHYENEFGKSLEEDIKGETSGNFENLLVSLCQAARDESLSVDYGKVEEDAKALLEAGEGQIGTNESIFNSIFCIRNFSHLRKTFERYEELSGSDIVSSIKSEMTGSLEDAFKDLASYIINSNKYFAKKLHDSMSGAGTDDEALIRLIVTRSEFDLKPISKVYNEEFGGSLRESIEGDCGGDYKKALLSILGNN